MLLLILVAILIGIGLPLQAGINAQLRIGVGHPLLAAFVSFFVGTVALGVANLALRVPLPGVGAAARLPWWQWSGGLLGALYIFASVILAPRLGAATLVSAIVAGQMMTSLVLDHFGLVGYATHPVSPGRLVGAVMVVAGVILLQRR
ncbi:MAG TPA: DMT family transporter [Gemmatimonadales bacterium]|nr:DMT family transporter [Gemmatimonadales bacterium]